MLKLAGFNSTIYSFNKKTGVSFTPSLLTFLMRLSLELNLFERRAIKTDYFTFNSTGNARRMANFSPRDIGGGVMENKVWY